MTECAQARILLVHLVSNDDVNVCKNLVEALSNFFSLTCSLSGSSVSFLMGIVMIGVSQTEVLLPLQSVHGNYPRIHSALCRLQEMVEWFNNSSEEPTSQDHSHFLQLAIQEAVEMFRRQISSQLQLEITVVSSNRSRSFAYLVNRVSRDMHLQELKKIQLIRVKSLDSFYDDEELLESIDATDNGQLFQTDCTDMLDIRNMDMHVLSLQNFLLSWLQDSSTDTEGLHLIFPNSDLVVKCDMFERLVNSTSLPFRHNFVLHCRGAISSRQMSTSSYQKNLKLTKTSRLEVVGRLSADDVCDSMVFGNPVILRSTVCWKIDWDELEVNQQMFQALCFYLNQQSMSLIARLVHDPLPQNSCAQQPQGYFILLPSPNCSLLMKSLAVSELVLPFDVPSLQTPSQENLTLVSDTLSQVKLLETYNPLTVRSGLFESLHLELMKSVAKQGRSRSKNDTASSAQPTSHKLSARDVYDSTSSSSSFPTKL